MPDSKMERILNVVSKFVILIIFPPYFWIRLAGGAVECGAVKFPAFVKKDISTWLLGG